MLVRIFNIGDSTFLKYECLVFHRLSMGPRAFALMPKLFWLLGFCSEPLNKSLIKKAPVGCVSLAKEEPAVLVVASFSHYLCGGMKF